MGVTLIESYNMPVAYRQFYLERINKEIESSSKRGETQSRAAHANTPDIRQLQGRARDQVPAKLRRFT